MLTRLRRGQKVKAIIGGFIWLMLRAPMDIALYNCQTQFFMYILALQVTDFIILVFIFYQFLQARVRRPWSCPVCEGWGKRYYTPGMSTTKSAQLATCTACEGRGFIWEELEKPNVED